MLSTEDSATRGDSSSAGLNRTSRCLLSKSGGELKITLLNQIMHLTALSAHLPHPSHISQLYQLLSSPSSSGPIYSPFIHINIPRINPSPHPIPPHLLSPLKSSFVFYILDTCVANFCPINDLKNKLVMHE